MLPEKTNLLDRINVAINKNWYKGKREISVLTDKPESAERNNPIDKNFFASSKNTVSIRKLQEKIAVLENQHDQFLCFINFLIDNFPNLVIDIVQGNAGKCNSDGKKNRDEEIADSWLKPNCFHDKAEPCPTRREKDVLQLLEKGLCAKEIANKLFISETTVIPIKKI